jgi:hypothetical protein
MGEMNQIGTFRLDLGDHVERFIKAEMGRMRALSKCIEHEHFSIPQQIDRAIRNVLGVGQIGQRANPETVDIPTTMRYRDRIDRLIKECEWTVELVEYKVWFSAIEGELIDECIAESFSQMSGSLGRRIDWEVCLIDLIEPAQVVESAKMVGVRMSEENSIDPLEASLYRL